MNVHFVLKWNSHENDKTEQQEKKTTINKWKECTEICERYRNKCFVHLRFPRKYLKYHLVWCSGFSRIGVLGDPKTYWRIKKMRQFLVVAQSIMPVIKLTLVQTALSFFERFIQFSFHFYQCSIFNSKTFPWIIVKWFNIVKWIHLFENILKGIISYIFVVVVVTNGY